MYAFVLGKSSERIKTQVVTSTDIKHVSAFETASDFLSKAVRQNLSFERIIIVAWCIGSEQELRGIKDYLLTNGLNTPVILLVREWESTDLQVLDVYYDIFTSPIYTDYTLKHSESADLPLFAFLCSGSLDKVRNEHSSLKNSAPNVRHQSVDVGVSQEPEKKVRVHCTFNSGVIKKITYGGKVFGRNKLTKKEQLAFKPLWSQANALLGVRGG